MVALLVQGLHARLRLELRRASRHNASDQATPDTELMMKVPWAVSSVNSRTESYLVILIRMIRVRGRGVGRHMPIWLEMSGRQRHGSTLKVFMSIEATMNCAAELVGVVGRLLRQLALASCMTVTTITSVALQSPAHSVRGAHDPPGLVDRRAIAVRNTHSAAVDIDGMQVQHPDHLDDLRLAPPIALAWPFEGYTAALSERAPR